MTERCARCGKNPADGLASINDDRYCHGDEMPSCYVLAEMGSKVVSIYIDAELWDWLLLEPNQRSDG